MSLEAALEAHTAALKENTAAVGELIAVTRKANEGREAALAAAASLNEGKTTTRKPRETKPSETAATTSETAAPAGPPSIDDVRAAFGAYLGVEDAAVRETRKEDAKAILAKFGVGKATEIPEENRAQALAWVKTLAEGGQVPELQPEAAEESLI